MIEYYIIAAICGIAVSTAEIVTRYKGEPLKALRCRWSLLYLLFNGLLPVAGFAILSSAGVVSDEASSIDKLKYALYVGFGAMVVIRAKLFNIKMESGEKGLGPDFVMDAFLSALDRQIDRYRAYDRAKIVREVMGDIDFMKVKTPLITLMTLSMQNITDSEMKELGRKVKETEQAQELSNQEKSYTLGFMILDLAGEDFFNTVFNENERKKYKIDKDASSDAAHI
jgi:hypothetical protein